MSYRFALHKPLEVGRLRCITGYIDVKNEVYKNGYRRRSCTSKTATIQHFVKFVMYCLITIVPGAFYSALEIKVRLRAALF